MNSLADILSQKADDLFDYGPAQSPDIPAPSSTSEQVAAANNAMLPALQLERMLYAMKGQIESMLRLIHGERLVSGEPSTGVMGETGERALAGSFTGSGMLGEDGKEYPVPPNYASKSKLVAGDKMKLTITKSGSFIYKQIGPVERKRMIGELIFDATLGQWHAQSEGKLYKILTASATFHKGKSGDEVIFIIPKNKASLWGAVDNILSK